MNNKPYSLEPFMEWIRKKNPGEPEFHQAVLEVARSIIPFIHEHPKYQDACILERLCEPDRIISFRVVWEDDKGNIRMNRGYRVQFNNSIGPYKGGLRFHPSVNTGIFKFLGFEQTFKNSLTTLPMGSAKGGADFDPKGKSDREIMRFCQSFMIELYHYIGHFTDIPAGDIGVGAQEISFLFGEYKRISHQFTGVLTGKSLEYGGSLIRKEATGYGCVYFMEEMLHEKGESIRGKTCVVSGSGNVALYCAQKINHLGGKVVTLSDSDGFIHVPQGISDEELDVIIEMKTVRKSRLSEYAEQSGSSYYAAEKPWGIECDLAFPCATENEISKSDAALLAGGGCIALAEGANMPTTLEAMEVLRNSGILTAPGKAANAGGVAVSGLEMAQNSMRMAWTTTDLESRLQAIMKNIHRQCVTYGKTNGYIDYVKGANIAGFIKVADAMLAYGIL